MAVSGLAKKLQLKPGYQILILNAPEGYKDNLGELPEGSRVLSKPSGKVDAVQLFVQNSEELDKFAQSAVDAVKHDGLLWVCYPKGTSKVKTDLNRDILWSKMRDQFNQRAVANVSIDDVWSAIRLRPVEKVGKW
jgi:hypothetical protein